MTPQNDSSLLYAALEAAANGVLITNANDVVEWANPACCRLTGYDLGELVGRHTRLLKSGCQSDDFYRDLWRTIADGGVWRGQLVNRRKDGSSYPEAMTITPVRDAHGRIAHYVAIKENIEERVGTDAALRQNEEINRVTFEQAAMGIAHVAPDGRFLRVNDAFCRVTGYTRDALLARAFQDITHGDDLAADLKHVRRVLKGELDTYTLEKRYVRPDESVVPVMLTVSLVRDTAGTPRFFISMVRDISTERERDLRLQRAQRLESLGTLASSIAHDLNNALAPILMSLELLNDSARDSDRSLIDTLQVSVTRASAMARQLLAFARGSDGQRVRVSPAGLIQEMRQILTTSLPTGIHVDVTVPTDLPDIVGDATQLHQVLLNLCVNARDAMPSGGTLTIDVGPQEVDTVFAAAVPDATPGRYLVIAVRDTGTGIPPHVFDRIFEPFFTTKAQQHGTGLGLATVLGIVKAHRGFVRVTTELGRGSTFAVYVPVAESAVETTPRRIEDDEFRGHGELVLLVDDDAPLRDIGSTVLRRLDLTPVVAADGTEGLIKALELRNTLRVVLLDVFMPHMDGLALARALRRALPNLRIGAVSGRFEEHVRTELHGLGVTTLLEKPFSEPDLATAMRNLLEPTGDERTCSG